MNKPFLITFFFSLCKRDCSISGKNQRLAIKLFALGRNNKSKVILTPPGGVAQFLWSISPPSLDKAPSSLSPADRLLQCVSQVLGLWAQSSGGGTFIKVVKKWLLWKSEVGEFSLIRSLVQHGFVWKTFRGCPTWGRQWAGNPGVSHFGKPLLLVASGPGLSCGLNGSSQDLALGKNRKNL